MKAGGGVHHNVRRERKAARIIHHHEEPNIGSGQFEIRRRNRVAIHHQGPGADGANDREGARHARAHGQRGHSGIPDERRDSFVSVEK